MTGTVSVPVAASTAGSLSAKRLVAALGTETRSATSIAVPVRFPASADSAPAVAGSRALASSDAVTTPRIRLVRRCPVRLILMWYRPFSLCRRCVFPDSKPALRRKHLGNQMTFSGYLGHFR